MLDKQQKALARANSLRCRYVALRLDLLARAVYTDGEKDERKTTECKRMQCRYEDQGINLKSMTHQGLRTLIGWRYHGA